MEDEVATGPCLSCGEYQFDTLEGGFLKEGKDYWILRCKSCGTVKKKSIGSMDNGEKFKGYTKVVCYRIDSEHRLDIVGQALNKEEAQIWKVIAKQDDKTCDFKEIDLW